ncbi:hypothetical protein KL930_001412 [Ogataea haglerorum]|uniref:Elongator complex protein 4 n=1 Tax=Ogataea haglerorum TaxID=1937702 RepID=A0AAN6D3Y5_9ASCO|nr:hypothetical protein KL951_001898 [Ogataea haglerorum]KAG7724896.1 hypothetical protein KL948_005141 [Ogataea haglerorum]KAG7726381.1 hypothetical protein KL933_003312 [Ogataea haglerorum]KAG7737830.1 hypothetical protein KL923_003377 [Ogataea haglerorum]KAG7780487.1 hypothetical protein KL922_000838 [Ogataea haglerorum]
MSFRRRGEIVSGRTSQSAGVPRPVIPSAASTRGTSQYVSRTAFAGGTPKRNLENAFADHVGVKPSILTSQPCISTGSSDIDSILGHQGLPIGSSILIEETGTTDFSSTLSKLFLAQGIVHNRINPSQPNTHDIVVGLDQIWAKSLPGVYKRSKERNREKVQQNESKVSVSNIVNQTNDLKIAWRYGLNQRKNESDDDTIDQYPHYNSQFDITSVITVAPGPHELTCIPNDDLSRALKRIEDIVIRHPNKIVRIAVPLFLNPLIYQNESSAPEIMRFAHGLKQILKKHANQVALLMTINLDLYPRNNPLIVYIELLFDSVIELRPFDPQLHDLMERVYRNQPAKIKHGHLNVYKLPVLSESGLMCVQEMEYSFKNGRRRFEIEKWSIPVEDEEKNDDKKLEF